MSDKVIVTAAQLFLSVAFISGYFLVLTMFMLGHAAIPVDYKEAFIGILGVCTGSVVSIVSFWFARTRTDQPIDPKLSSLMTKMLDATPKE